MGKIYDREWKMRLNPKRFRDSSTKTSSPGKDYNTGWNPFDSDYARIAMSAPFRRLQDKAQVFPLEPNDFVRTRLTHSIEVSSVARSIGVAIENWLISGKHINHDKRGHIPSVLATSCLAHDIGNPPFGHSAEKCIQAFFNNNPDHISGLSSLEQADLKNFDGNPQGFRLLLRLGLASDEFSYNLTFPTLATIVKYPKDSIVGNKGDIATVSFKKYGFYQTDKEKYLEINKTLELCNKRHPLCFLLESADDICYSVSDIEDGFKKKTISLELLLSNLTEKYNNDKECIELKDKIKDKIIAYKGYKNKDYLIAQDCRIFAQQKMIHSAVSRFKDNHEAIINGEFDEELLDDSSSMHLRRFFKDISNNNFNHKSVIKRELIGDTVVSYLLNKLIPAVLSKKCDNPKTVEGKLCSLLSNQSKNAMNQTRYENKKYLKLLMVVDFIASMTDSYAVSLYKDLCGFE